MLPLVSYLTVPFLLADGRNGLFSEIEPTYFILTYKISDSLLYIYTYTFLYITQLLVMNTH